MSKGPGCVQRFDEALCSAREQAHPVGIDPPMYRQRG
jgi:hypothetical protein